MGYGRYRYFTELWRQGILDGSDIDALFPISRPPVDKPPTLEKSEKKLLADMEAKQEETINKLKEDYDRGWFGTEDSEGGLESWLPDSANDPTDFFGNLNRIYSPKRLSAHRGNWDKPSLWQRFKRWFTWRR